MLLTVAETRRRSDQSSVCGVCYLIWRLYCPNRAFLPRHIHSISQGKSCCDSRTVQPWSTPSFGLSRAELTQGGITQKVRRGAMVYHHTILLRCIQGIRTPLYSMMCIQGYHHNPVHTGISFHCNVHTRISSHYAVHRDTVTLSCTQRHRHASLYMQGYYDIAM